MGSIFGGNLNLTASFDHQRAAKIVCPLVVENVLSDSEFPPKMEPILQPHEPPCGFMKTFITVGG